MRSFGKHLEEIHVTWTQFEKKRDNIATLHEDDQDGTQHVEMASQFPMTTSKSSRDDVRVADTEEAQRRFYGLTTSQFTSDVVTP
ncbi:hypothetical protein Tco_1565220 [Tanacetum coccineum]